MLHLPSAKATEESVARNRHDVIAPRSYAFAREKRLAGRLPNENRQHVATDVLLSEYLSKTVDVTVEIEFAHGAQIGVSNGVLNP
jgi:hypothetical protein